MSIEALVDPAPAVLSAAAARPDVTSAMDEAHAALADLRFSEGLRRGWEEARAEAAVREAAALSIICLLYTSPSPRDRSLARMPSAA